MNSYLNNKLYPALAIKNEKNNHLQQISIDTYTSLQIFRSNEILYFEIENEIVYVKLVSFLKVPVKHSLKELENRLKQFGFYRVHARCLANLTYVRIYVHKTGELILTDGIALKVAKDRKAGFKKKLEKLFGK